MVGVVGSSPIVPTKDILMNRTKNKRKGRRSVAGLAENKMVMTPLTTLEFFTR